MNGKAGEAAPADMTQHPAFPRGGVRSLDTGGDVSLLKGHQVSPLPRLGSGSCRKFLTQHPSSGPQPQSDGANDGKTPQAGGPGDAWPGRGARRGCEVTLALHPHQSRKGFTHRGRGTSALTKPSLSALRGPLRARAGAPPAQGCNSTFLHLCSPSQSFKKHGHVIVSILRTLGQARTTAPFYGR